MSPSSSPVANTFGSRGRQALTAEASATLVLAPAPDPPLFPFPCAHSFFQRTAPSVFTAQTDLSKDAVYSTWPVVGQKSTVRHVLVWWESVILSSHGWPRAYWQSSTRPDSTPAAKMFVVGWSEMSRMSDVHVASAGVVVAEAASSSVERRLAIGTEEST